ncbi:hypothetical protein V8C37DRAFT_381897 [Trichoderma ceciliae]
MICHLEFYREEVGGDTRNYLHNCVGTTGQPMLIALRVQDVSRDTTRCAKRIDEILKGRSIYEQSRKDSVRGYMAMHTTNSPIQARGSRPG